MSSSNNVLRAAVVGDHAFHLDGVNSPPDPVIMAALEDARREGHHQGYREGHAAGVAESLDAVRAREDRATSAIATAVTHAEHAIGEAIRGSAGDVLDLGLQIARVIVGAAADEWARSLGMRLLSVLSSLDDDDLVVRVHPDDLEEVRDLLPSSVGFTADEALRPGDARIAGRWSQADLTLEQAWRAVEAELREQLSD